MLKCYIAERFGVNFSRVKYILCIFAHVIGLRNSRIIYAFLSFNIPKLVCYVTQSYLEELSFVRR